MTSPSENPPFAIDRAVLRACTFLAYPTSIEDAVRQRDEWIEIASQYRDQLQALASPPAEVPGAENAVRPQPLAIPEELRAAISVEAEALRGTAAKVRAGSSGDKVAAWIEMSVRGLEASLPQSTSAPSETAAARDALVELRAANIAREKEWAPGKSFSLSFRGNELAGGGRGGLQHHKKLDRERMGLVGSRATAEQLAEELADVMICVDLIAMDIGLDLWPAVVAKFNAVSAARSLKTSLAESEPPPPRSGEDVGAEETPWIFSYKNWRGERSIRRVRPISLYFGSTEWHPEPQWLLRALDYDKDAVREFACADISVVGEDVGDKAEIERLETRLRRLLDGLDRFDRLPSDADQPITEEMIDGAIAEHRRHFIWANEEVVPALAAAEARVAALEATLAERDAVIAGAREALEPFLTCHMPRKTPAAGGSCTGHIFAIEAGEVWAFDRACLGAEKALSALRAATNEGGRDGK